MTFSHTRELVVNANDSESTVFNQEHWLELSLTY